MTAINWPGPSLPFSIIFSGISTIPVSDPAQNILSVVIEYLSGLNPFLSVAAIAHLLSEAQIAAGPSQGSIVLLRTSKSCW